MMNFNNKLFVFASLLLLLNLAAHFLPFERASLAPDDYTLLSEYKDTKIAMIPKAMLNYCDRPLGFAIMILQAKLVGDNSNIGFILIVFSNIILLAAVFYLFYLLFKDPFIVFVASLIFSLLPNKLEIYHTPIFVYINIVLSIYILSMILFIKFTEKGNKIYFAISLIAYTIGILWYEVGFFMPLIMGTYVYLYKKEKIKYMAWFFIPFFGYAIYRLTGAFGMASLKSSHNVNLSIIPINAFLDLVHQYFGRYMIRNIIYGVYKFISIELSWLIILVLLNFFIFIMIALHIRKYEIKFKDNRLLLLAGMIFVVFLLPLFLNYNGGIGGRHLVLPSIGVSIFGIWLLHSSGRLWRFILLSFVIVLLIICEGNAWTQVIACRINGAVYNTLKENKSELLKANNIIIDTKSFADNIPFTLIQRDFNVLNTYYGAQVFENWGLESMVKLVTGNNEKRVYIATERLKIKNNTLVEFAVSERNRYRSVRKKNIILPVKDTYIVDFKNVYGITFNNGIRKE